MSTFSFIFRTPFETLVQEDIEWLSLDIAGGRIQVFPHHATLTDHVPFSFVRFRHGMKEYNYFIRSGILHINNEKNEVDLHCLFADQVDKTVHTSVREHLEWIREKLVEGESGVRTIGSYEKTFLEKQGIALNKQLTQTQGK
jgi:F0F1-type ATP synthase epsilon subunit